MEQGYSFGAGVREKWTVSALAIVLLAFEVEITERALIRNPGEAERVVESLRELGVRVSIDDFGTGYSSFEFLRRLPLTGYRVEG